VPMRRFFHWKCWFYDILLPALRQLGPARCDAALGLIGRGIEAAWPGRRRELTGSIRRVGALLGADWQPQSIRPALAGNMVRGMARDCSLSGASHAEALSRFDVEGSEHLDNALAAGKGTIVVGCHLGAHVAAWLPLTRA
jgi:lauroyl/myristoyl acyltransferase